MQFQNIVGVCEDGEFKLSLEPRLLQCYLLDLLATYFLPYYQDSQQRDDVYLQRLEVLEASIQRQSTGIRTFVPTVPMIGLDPFIKNPKQSYQDGDASGNLNESESMDADIMNNSGGSDITELMADLDDSGDDVTASGGR